MTVKRASNATVSEILALTASSRKARMGGPVDRPRGPTQTRGPTRDGWTRGPGAKQQGALTAMFKCSLLKRRLIE